MISKKYKLIKKFFKHKILESVSEDGVHLLLSYSLRINLVHTFPSYFQRRSLFKTLIPMVVVVSSPVLNSK